MPSRSAHPVAPSTDAGSPLSQGHAPALDSGRRGCEREHPRLLEESPSHPLFYLTPRPDEASSILRHDRAPFPFAARASFEDPSSRSLGRGVRSKARSRTLARFLSGAGIPSTSATLKSFSLKALSAEKRKL